MRRALLLVALALVVAVDLLPLALVVKQAVTPEAESLAWPPSWLPRTLTAANFADAARAVELGRALLLSAGVALATVAGTLLLALPAAWAAARRPALGRRLDGAVVLVRVFPAVSLAVPLAVVFVGLGLYNHPAGLGLACAHTLVALPVAFLVLRAGFRGVPTDLEEAARLDGATATGAFLRVTLPLVRPALGTAALLVFLVSWDEFAYALLLQVTNRPLPPLLFYLAAFGHPGLASAVAVLMLGPALLVILVLEPALRSGVLAGSGR